MKKQTLKGLLLFGILLWINSAFAQDCNFTISGRVFDEHDHQALEYARIQVLGTDKVGFSDSTGRYSISGLCRGKYVLVCSHVGCEDITKKVNLNKNSKVNFYPEHHAEELAQALVAKKKEDTGIEVEQEIDDDELERSKAKSLGDALENINGIRTLKTGNNIAKPVINGLHSNRIQILNNGVRQEGQQWGSEHAPSIDAFTAEELIVIKGSESIRYGSENIGGFIVTRPKRVNSKPGYRFGISSGAFSNGRQGYSSLKLEGRSKRVPALYASARGTIKRAGNIHSPDYYLKNTGTAEQAVSSLLGFQTNKLKIEAYYSLFVTDLGVFSGAHIGNLSDLQRAFLATEPLEKAEFSYTIDRPRQEISHELIKGDASIRTGSTGKLSLTYSRQYNSRAEYDKHRPLNDSLAGLDRPEFDLRLKTNQYDLNWEHVRVKGYKGAVGINGLYQENITKGRQFIPNYKKRNLGAYAYESWKDDSSFWLIDAGLRYDQISQQAFRYENGVLQKPEFDYAGFSFSSNVGRKISQQLHARVSFGWSWRAPAMNELYSNGVHHGAAAVEIGDANLKRERVVQTALVLAYRFNKGSFELEPYIKSFQDFINLTPVLPPTLTIRGAFPTFEYQQYDATFKGLDASFTYQFTEDLQAKLQASILRAKDEFDRFIPLIPADRYNGAVVWNLHDHKFLEESKLSFGCSYTAMQTRIDQDQDYVAPPDAYFVFSASAQTNIQFRKGQLEVALEANNLFNNNYRDYLDRFRYFTDAMGRNIGLHLKWPMHFNHH